jgi:enoyl-CoA hydratase/long-chain 3-hydroxyacyl-CoA dehydrogenase
MTQYQCNINTSNIVPLTDKSPSLEKYMKKADLVIEAVFEDLNLKRKLVQKIEEECNPQTIFATNTSAIPIASIAHEAKRPNQIIGMHYFSPVPQMQLLEIIPHVTTDDWVTATALHVGIQQSKTCIVVKDVPGFYVNRCLGPYLVEVSALLKDGVPLEKLDQAMTRFGMPVGPISLADEVGIDVTSHVATFLSNADLGDRMGGGDVSLLSNMREKGWLGKKSNQGFYTYDQKTKKKSKVINPDIQSYINSYKKQTPLKLDDSEIQNRLVCRFVNEAVKCLEDEIISDPVCGDIGMVFGTGFAPFRGGPFRYLDTFGIQAYVDMMDSFVEKYDATWFEPCQLMRDYAKEGKKFYK